MIETLATTVLATTVSWTKKEGALQPKQEKSSSYANNLLKDTRSHIRPGRALLGKKQKKWRSSDEYFQSLICGSEGCLVGPCTLWEFSKEADEHTT